MMVNKLNEDYHNQDELSIVLSKILRRLELIPFNSTNYRKDLSAILKAIPDTQDLKPVIEAIQGVQDEIKTIDNPKPTDYTDKLEELKKAILEIKIPDLPKLPEFKFGPNGRLLVSDVGGGGTRAVSLVDSGGNDVSVSTAAKQDALLTELEKKADLTETQPVSASSLPLPVGASTETKQDAIISALNSIAGDPFAKYKFADLDDDASPNYYGATDASGNWYILKEDTTAKTLRYATGNSDYPTNWTNRASLTYQYLYEVTIY